MTEVSGRKAELPWGRSSVLARYPDFRRLLVGNSISLLGSSVTSVALPLAAVVYLRATPVQMGVLGAAALAPHLVLGLPAGVWVDRLSYRRVLVLTDLAQTLLVGAIPVLALLGVLSMWHLYVIVLLAGVCNLFETVAAQSYVPSLVPRQKLLSGNSALMVSNAMVSTTGSALGSVLVVVFAGPTAIAVDAASFLLACLCKLRISTPAPAVTPALLAKPRLVADIRDGLIAVFAHRIIRVVTIASTFGALAGQMQAVVLVLYMIRDLRLSSGLVGAAVTLAGVAGILCALVAASITRRIGPGRAYVAGMFISAIGGLALASAAGPIPMMCVILVVAQVLRGAGPSLFGVNQQTLRQALIAPGLVARVNATWRFLVYGIQPLGALLGGLLGSIGLRTTLVIGSVIMLAGTAIAVVSPLWSLRQISAQSYPDSVHD